MINEYLHYFLDGFVYNIIDAITFGLGVALLIAVISFLTPLKNWDKIKENVIALTVIWGIIFLIFGAYIIAGYLIPETGQ